MEQPFAPHEQFLPNTSDSELGENNFGILNNLLHRLREKSSKVVSIDPGPAVDDELLIRVLLGEVDQRERKVVIGLVTRYPTWRESFRKLHAEFQRHQGDESSKQSQPGLNE